jgi:CheY-like chemotaxis protein
MTLLEGVMANILLAEDDEAVRAMLQRALEAEGHAVVGVGDGLAAESAAAASDFALVISDISMPEPDGVTLVERLRTRQPGLRVILMSAVADELDRAQNLAGPTTRILGKPVTLERMRKEVADLLGA